jgi:hypothetical protein
MSIVHKIQNFAQTDKLTQGLRKVDPILNNEFKNERKINQYLFPDKQSPPPEVAPPAIDQRAIDREVADLARRRKGYAGTVVAGDSPAPARNVSTTSLLGG